MPATPSILDLDRFNTVVVTGGAGFIGSRVCEMLLDAGHQLRVIDCFTNYYDRAVKERNLTAIRDHPNFQLHELDLATADLSAAIDGASVVLHLAAMPGLVRSWTDVAAYSHCNVVATARLLQAVTDHAPAARFVQVSTSSVYGLDATGDETTPLKPASPYGVTKLAAEHLCSLYAENWGVDTVALRYFTVFGPRQRPDMSIHRLCEAVGTGASFPRFGDGKQVREFTYVSDIVAANLLAGDAEVEPGIAMNIAGGGEITLNELIAMVGHIAGTELTIEDHPAQAGDARRNGGATDRAHELLGWEPSVSLRDGISAQLAWHDDRRRVSV